MYVIDFLSWSVNKAPVKGRQALLAVTSVAGFTALFNDHTRN